MQSRNPSIYVQVLKFIIIFKENEPKRLPSKEDRRQFIIFMVKNQASPNEPYHCEIKDQHLFISLLADKWKGNNRIKHHHLAIPSELMDPSTEQCLMLTTKKTKIKHPVPTGKRAQCHLPNGLNLIRSVNTVPSLQKNTESRNTY